MNENTTALIRELAEKLGTTAEHLWGVLVTQAPISGAISLLLTAFWITAIIVSFRFIRAKTSGDRPEIDEEAACWLWFAWGVVSVLALIGLGSGLHKLVSAFLNPEYWALMQILDLLK